ncbi:MAG: ROK family protein, partial [Pseudomonadales bacterium]|nr:ROK family protein [Pseudomonadales bacterium]
EVLASALSTVVNIVDPDVIVLGGGLSNIAGLAERVEQLLGKYIFSSDSKTKVRQASLGDSSGVFGAAFL